MIYASGLLKDASVDLSLIFKGVAVGLLMLALLLLQVLPAQRPAPKP
jgi:hypothetical protein